MTVSPLRVLFYYPALAKRKAGLSIWVCTCVSAFYLGKNFAPLYLKNRCTEIIETGLIAKNSPCGITYVNDDIIGAAIMTSYFDK